MLSITALLPLACLLSGCAGAKRNTLFLEMPVPAAEPAKPEQPSPPLSEAAPFIYVRGEFRSPGRFPWTNGMTLRDGIEAAGGFTEFAERRVRLIRSDGSSQTYRLHSGWSATNNPLLNPDDSLLNPRRLL